MNKIVLIILLIPMYCLGSSVTEKNRGCFPSISGKSKVEQTRIVDHYCRQGRSNRLDCNNRTILFHVRHEESVKLLVQSKANVNHQDFLGETVLGHVLGRSGATVKFVKYLLKAKVDPFIENKRGLSVLDRLKLCNSHLGEFVYFGEKSIGYKNGVGGLVLKAIRSAAV
jgi:hypothetical protein